jgi:cytochrome oxidase assembly protein ShyY1
MGFWVTDILRLDSGKEIVVVRGWTPTTKSASESPTVAQPPSGQVNLTGWLMAAEHGTQPNLPMTQIAHVNNASMHVQPALTSMFVIVDLTRTSVAHVATESSGVYGITVPLPSDGPHHSYAWQWRAFAALVIVGWGALVRTELKQRRGEASAHQAAAVL